MDSTESVSHTPPQSQRRLRPRVGGAAAISKTSSSSNILESRQWAEQGPILDPPHTSSAETQNHLPATDDELDISSGSFLQLMQASSPFPVQNGGKTQPDVTASRADLLSSVVPTETRQQASQEGKESVTAQDPENENVGLKHARTSARKVRSVQTYPIPAPKLQLRQGRQNQSLDRLRMRALQGKASTAPSPSQQQPLSLQGKNDNPGFLGPTPSPAPSVVSSRGLKAKQPPLSSPAAALMSMQLAAMSRANVATMKSSSGVGSPTTSPTLPIAGTPVHASPWLTPYGSPYLSGPSRSSLLSSMLANSYYQQPPGSPFYPPSSLSPHPFSNPYLTASTYNHLMSMVPMPMTSPLKAKRASKGSSTYHGSPAISRRPTVGIGMARPQGRLRTIHHQLLPTILVQTRPPLLVVHKRPRQALERHLHRTLSHRHLLSKLSSTLLQDLDLLLNMLVRSLKNVSLKLRSF
ncbi:hypothetical protein BC829DRAFT_270034 [Chytridium lagenaria]|nr:hypothetical protein BC829DRAFT_270034 [Chytridium lagenaria]